MKRSSAKLTEPCQYERHRSPWDWRLNPTTDGSKVKKDARYVCGVCHPPPYPLLENGTVQFDVRANLALRKVAE